MIPAMQGDISHSHPATGISYRPAMDPVRTLILQKIKEMNLSLAGVSRKLGKNTAYLQQYIKRRSPERLGELERKRLALILGVNESDLGAPEDIIPLRQSGDTLTVLPGQYRPLPVIGRVAAGMWLEIDGNDEFGEPLFEIPIPRDPRYPAEAVYGLLVEGTSLNKTARPGEVLVCLDILALGIDPADGDLVVVERIKNQGGLREVTAKRLRIKTKPRSIELWPESDDPRWQTPIVLDGEPPDDDLEVRIIARVELIVRKP